MERESHGCGGNCKGCVGPIRTKGSTTIEQLLRSNERLILSLSQDRYLETVYFLLTVGQSDTWRPLESSSSLIIPAPR